MVTPSYTVTHGLTWSHFVHTHTVTRSHTGDRPPHHMLAQAPFHLGLLTASSLRVGTSLYAVGRRRPGAQRPRGPGLGLDLGPDRPTHKGATALGRLQAPTAVPAGKWSPGPGAEHPGTVRRERLGGSCCLPLEWSPQCNRTPLTF